jgi:hypothetical protein
MSNGQVYKVKVRATYKDFLPVEFALDVQYLPNLDGKTKFIDLGTHVFYKSSSARPATDFKFKMRGVTDERVDDDVEDYTFALRDKSEL